MVNLKLDEKESFQNLGPIDYLIKLSSRKEYQFTCKINIIRPPYLVHEEPE